MLKKDIKVGGTYTAKVAGNITTVRVDAIREIGGGFSPYKHVYDVTNLRTGRTTTFRSAAKFRAVANTPAAPKPTTDPRNVCSCCNTQLVGAYPGAFEPVVCYSCRQKALESTPVPVDDLPPREERDELMSEELAADLAKRSDQPTVVEDEQCSDPTPTAPTSTVIPPTNLLSAQIAAVPQITGHKPTGEQQAIIDAARGLNGKVLVIEAGAGAGKTSTLKMLEQVMQGNGQYTAFNASLVAESKTKFTKAACNTTHSLAFRAVGKQFAHRLGGARVRGDEVARMLGITAMKVETGGTKDDGTPNTKTLDAGLLASHAMKAVARFCQSADREIDLKHFGYLDGIDMPADGRKTYANNDRVKAYLLPHARAVWADLSSPGGSLPFAHDHYVKVWQLNNPIIAADYIMLDEAQDTAPVILDILKQQTATVVIVGDSNQSIYEWRGAVDALAAYPDAERRQLSQSFRFGQAIADVANSVLASMVVRTTLRLKGLPSIASRIDEVLNPRCILTRTNAAAVASVLGAIRDGKKPHLVGGGVDMVRFVEAALVLQQGRTTSHPELALFSSWTDVQTYVKLDEGSDLKLMVKLIDEFGAKSILDALRNMPAEKDADVVVSTAHKSKGREWDTVRLAADFPTNSKSTDADRKLLYVAATRAKLVLDISQCPFFTGEDALEIELMVAPTTNDSTPTVQPQREREPVTKFTWSKGRNGDWLVRGPQGATGEVDVERKNGSKQKKTLGRTVFNGDGMALYQVS